MASTPPTGATRPPTAAKRPLTGRERHRRTMMLTRIALVLWIVFALCAATAIYFGTVSTLLVGPDGATLDCGSILIPPESQYAAGGCAGAGNDFVTGFVISSAGGIAALVVGVVLFARSRRGIHW